MALPKILSCIARNFCQRFAEQVESCTVRHGQKSSWHYVCPTPQTKTAFFWWSRYLYESRIHAAFKSHGSIKRVNCPPHLYLKSKMYILSPCVCILGSSPSTTATTRYTENRHPLCVGSVPWDTSGSFSLPQTRVSFPFLHTEWWCGRYLGFKVNRVCGLLTRPDRDRD